jgi:hypothetical protein
MELVNTENKVTNIIHDVRYNTINFRIYLKRWHSDCNVTAESFLAMVYNIYLKLLLSSSSSLALQPSMGYGLLVHKVP